MGLPPTRAIHTIQATARAIAGSPAPVGWSCADEYTSGRSSPALPQPNTEAERRDRAGRTGGMSRPLLKLGGGSVEILRDVLD